MSFTLAALTASTLTMMKTTEAIADASAPAPGTNGVLSRMRPGLDPVGIPVSGFRLYPTFDLTTTYDDNIYNSDSLVVKSAVFTIQPRIVLQSDWNVHSLMIDANGNFARYSGAKSENSDTYTIHSVGRLDVTRNIRIDADGHFTRATETRGTSGDVFVGGDPIVYRTFGGTLGTGIGLGRFLLQVGANVDRTAYDDARVGSLTFSQRYRNRNAYGLTGQLGYEISPSITTYVQAIYDRQRYDIISANGWLDSNGLSILGGIQFDITKLISGKIGVGYLRRSYRNPFFTTTSGLTYDASVIWNPTTLLTFTLTARKAVDESPQIGASGIVTNSVTLVADYELLRNLILDAQLGFTGENYKGISRDDHRLNGGVAFRYLMNRFLELGLRYDHLRQTGSGNDGRDYHDNRVGVSLTVQR